MINLIMISGLTQPSKTHVPKKSNIPECSNSNSIKSEHKLSPDHVKVSDTVEDEDNVNNCGDEKENSFHENSSSDLDMDNSNNKVKWFCTESVF